MMMDIDRQRTPQNGDVEAPELTNTSTTTTAVSRDADPTRTASHPRQGPQRDRMQPRRAIHFLLERVATQPETYSGDLVECMRQPWWGDLVRGDFVHPDYYQLLNHKNLAKELTEAWTSYLKVVRLLERIDLSLAARRRQLELDPLCAGEADVEEPELYLFDMCSGKGFNVFLISKMLPGRFKKIYAIDKDQKMNLDHFAALSAEENGTRVKFKYADVHHRRFSEWLARKLGAPGGNEGNRKARRHRKWVAEKQRKRPTDAADDSAAIEPMEQQPSSSSSLPYESETGAAVKPNDEEREIKQRQKRRRRIGLFLGVHLCGELSQTFIDLYNKNPRLAGMVLSPCCLPKHDRGPVERAKKVGLDSYSYWALQLYLMVGPGPLLTYKDLTPVVRGYPLARFLCSPLVLSDNRLNFQEDVLSTKNAFITAIKRPFLKELKECTSAS